MASLFNQKEIYLPYWLNTKQHRALHNITIPSSGLFTSTMWGASLVLMGFIINNITRLNQTAFRITLTALSILGILLSCFVWIFARQLNSVKNQKYARCHQIEEKLNMYQNRDLRYKKGSQKFLYSVVMIVFLLIWFVIVYAIWNLRLQSGCCRGCCVLAPC